MYDYLAKVILLGPSGTGKSCLLHRFVKNECTRRITLRAEYLLTMFREGTLLTDHRR